MEIVNGFEHYNNIGVGENSTNNLFNSSRVTANRDGSLLERNEYVIDRLESIVIADFVLSDFDNFDVADADADTTRWDAEYITGTEGGSSDINTTTAGKLMVKVDPDATPSEARYAVSHNLPLYADFFTVTADMDTTWGATDSATAKAAGMIFSAGSAYDATNYLAVERQKGTSINRFTVSGKLNNVAISATNVNTTDDAVSLRVQRFDNVWRFYYSLTQYPHEVWVLIAQVEDPSCYMTNQVSLYFEAYSVGSADTESIKADFDNFQYFIGAGGGGQYIAGDYSSAWVASDDDGNVLERLEDIREGAFKTGGADFSLQINNQTANENLEDFFEEVTVWIGINGANQLTKLSNVTPATLDAAIQSFGAVIGIDGTNTYSVTIQGAARTTLEASFTGMAAYMSAGGAQWAVTMNNGAASNELETTVENLLTWIGINGTNTLTNLSNAAVGTLNAAIQSFAATVGIDGANTYSVTLQGVDRTTIESSFTGVGAYFSAAGAAWSVQMNNAAATTDLEATIESFIGWIGIDGTNQLSKLSNVTPTSLNNAIQSFAATVGIDGTNEYSVTINGVARTTLEASFTGVASYLSASGAALSIQLNNQTARGDYEQVFEDYFTMWGVNGTNAYSVTVNGGAVTTVKAVHQAIASDIEHLYALADGGTNAYPDSVVQESILAYLMSKSADPVVTSFDNRTDSLEMLSDKFGAFSGDGGAAQDDSVKASLDLAHTDLDTIITDTAPLWDTTLTGASVVSGSIASFVATGGTALGTVLPASTSLYDTTKNINTVAITSAPVEKTLSDILHKDGSFTFDNTTDSLEAIADSISEGSLQIEADAGSTASAIIDAATLTQATANWWKGALLLSINGDNSGQARPIVAFDETTDTVTVSPPFLAAPTAGDDFLVISGWKMPEWVPVPAAAINTTAVVAPGVDVLDLTDADNKESYRLNGLRLKFADPGAQTVTVTLYELINNVSTAVDTFTVTTDNYTTYYSLVDMFGVPQVCGDDITINATVDGGAGVAVTGQYQYDVSFNA